ncbi:MAG: tRNA-specific 2-thiouridylase [Flavobacteriales bacterium]|jgi:tRNA-specific 2-thiouridylase
MSRVVVGLSGGVDSSVAAALLIEQGYEVIGMFMRNWHDESVTINNECPWIDDSNDAMLVAEKLGIPFQVIDLSADYHTRIVDYMFDEYQKGRTPNPDILCNREIKFDVFLKAALELGADYVATGHYCRRKTVTDAKLGEVHQLLAGVDGNKDQSYFLCQLNQEQLAKAIFPVGDLTKPDVRIKAKELDLVTADKKDSQGLCFIGKVKLPVFLQQQLAIKEGKVVEIDEEISRSQRQNALQELNALDGPCFAPKYSADMGSVVAKHQGAHFYTIGQRKGVNVGGRPLPSFVIATDVESNIVYTGQGESHLGLHRAGLKIHESEVHFIRPDHVMKDGDDREYLVRIRYRQPLVKARLIFQDSYLYLLFEKEQRGVAAGQFAAWYHGDELIGSGVIH